MEWNERRRWSCSLTKNKYQGINKYNKKNWIVLKKLSNKKNVWIFVEKMKNP